MEGRENLGLPRNKDDAMPSYNVPEFIDAAG